MNGVFAAEGNVLVFGDSTLVIEGGSLASGVEILISGIEQTVHRQWRSVVWQAWIHGLNTPCWCLPRKHYFALSIWYEG